MYIVVADGEELIVESHFAAIVSNAEMNELTNEESDIEKESEAV